MESKSARLKKNRSTDAQTAATVRLQQRASAWRRAARTAMRRHRRLLRRLETELDAASQAPALRAGGEALKTQLHRVEPGADQVVLQVPWMQPSVIVVHLRRDLSPRANLKRIFRRAKGFEAALPLIRRRLDQTNEMLSSLEVGVAALDEVLSEPTALAETDLEQIVSRLQAAGARLPARREEQHPQTQKLRRTKVGGLPKGVRRFWTARGVELLAGRDALSNDALVTRMARGRDVWMHVRDLTGAHVVLRMRKMDDAPDGRDLLEAAVLCAHLSGVGKDASIDVAWTRSKYVRKPKGAAPGLVLISGEKTIRVVVRPEAITALYKRRDQRLRAER